MSSFKFNITFRTLIYTLFLCALLCESKHLNEARQSVRVIPDGLMFGASTASYQIEGGWDSDGKGENIWDRLTHTDPCAVKDCSGGDIACDSYNNYKRDVEMVRELGLDMYRFSLSWSRILPTGFPNQINEAGVQYYNNLIDELLKYNITPLVTIYHWDLPQPIQDLGGWANPHIVDWFTDYVRVAYEKFGDRVKEWITINEPRAVCNYGYGDSRFAPRVNSHGIGEYMCTKYLLLAHAKAYRIYDNEFRQSQNGKVGIAMVAQWYEPDTENDVEAAETIYQFFVGSYLHPIFSETGNWPRIVEEKVAAKSAAQGFKRSRLPSFTPEEVELIRGSSDFLGLNHYTTNLVNQNIESDDINNIPSMDDDHEVKFYQPSKWTTAASSWLKVYSPGFYNMLMYTKQNYNNPPIYITENGFSSRGGLDDNDRISYYRLYIDSMLDAMEDGCDIRVYAPWSLMDNFEWLQGYTELFGLYEVDFQSPQRTRTPRKSAFVYKEIVRTRTLDPNYEPDNTVMTIDDGH